MEQEFPLKRFLICAFIVLLSVILTIFMVIVSLKDSDSEKGSQNIKVDYSVSIDTIYRDFNENEIRAKEKHEGNRYLIRAECNDIETGGLLNIGGGATLTMYKVMENTHVYFFAEFEKDQEERLKRVNKGDTITFIGTCLGSFNFTDCEIVR